MQTLTKQQQAGAVAGSNEHHPLPFHVVRGGLQCPGAAGFKRRLPVEVHFVKQGRL